MSRWERGVVTPGPHYRVLLCRLFEKSPEELGFAEPAHPVGNLPIPPTALIGREDELATGCSLLRSRTVRLVTIAGPPGVGKTRLALTIAHELRGDFAGGVFFVPLASLAEPDLVCAAIRQALGRQERASPSLLAALAALAAELAGGRPPTLLVLDNFEHLLPAATILTELLARSQDLRLLVTSRVDLNLRGEHVLDLPPLPVPAAELENDVRALRCVPSVALFLERADAASRPLQLTPATAHAVAEICRRLDGLPLALELASAWLKLLDPPALLAHLESRLTMLGGGSRDLPDRQRTMRGALRWSYDLLQPDERSMFRRLSIFAGGASLDAVDAVWQAEDSLPGSLDVLVRLAAKHLLVSDAADGQVRVSMLDTIREYARELLEAQHEVEATATAHLSHFVSLAERAESRLTGPDQQAWLAALEREHDNIRAALGTARDRRDAACGLHLATRLWRFWDLGGHWVEGLGWLDGFLAGPSEPSMERAEALKAAGSLAARLGDLPRAVANYEQSLALCQSLGDFREAARLLSNLGWIAVRRGDLGQAVPLLETAVKLNRAHGDERSTAGALSNLGAALDQLGSYERAASIHLEALQMRRSAGNRAAVAVSLNNLGVVVRMLGRQDEAAALLAESVAICRELDTPQLLGLALRNLADLVRVRGDDVSAVTWYRESLRLCERIDDRVGIAHCLEGMAAVACTRGNVELATRLLGAAARLREVIHAPLGVTGRADQEAVLERIRSALTDEAFVRALQAGRGMLLKDAQAAALSDRALA